MIDITTSIDIDAPVARVWQVVTDVNAYAEWNPLIPMAQGTPVVGSGIRMKICPPGLMAREAEVEVLNVDAERQFRWLGRWGLPWILDGDHSFLLEAIGQQQTHLQQNETFRGLLALPLAPVVLPRMRQGFIAMNLALKKRCEQMNEAV